MIKIKKQSQLVKFSWMCELTWIDKCEHGSAFSIPLQGSYYTGEGGCRCSKMVKWENLILNQIMKSYVLCVVADSLYFCMQANLSPVKTVLAVACCTNWHLWYQWKGLASCIFAVSSQCLQLTRKQDSDMIRGKWLKALGLNIKTFVLLVLIHMINSFFWAT